MIDRKNGSKIIDKGIEQGDKRVKWNWMLEIDRKQRNKPIKQKWNIVQYIPKSYYGIEKPGRNREMKRSKEKMKENERKVYWGVLPVKF
jgi:hypothetical protein